MQIIFLITGIIGLIWCMVPRLVYGVLNIGNVTGLIVFFLILMVGIFWKKVKKAVGALWQKKAGKTVLSVFFGIIAIVAVFVIVETVCMFATTKSKPAGNETVVILGSYVSRSGPSIMTKCRLNSAKEYLDEHPEAICIVTGGQGVNEPWPEADAMKDYLVNCGIDEERILKERESKNTRENLANSLEIIREEGLNERIVIISNEFHLYRAGRIADRLGIEHAYVSAASPWGMFSSFYIRELYAILADWFVYS